MQSSALEESAAKVLGADRRQTATMQRLPPTTYHGQRAEVGSGPVAVLDCIARANDIACPAGLRPPPHGLSGRDLMPAFNSIDAFALERAGVVDCPNMPGRISEEFRLIQRQVLRNGFTRSGREPGYSNLLMVTSARSGEGKSFTSINLAASIARQGDRDVLIIDADPKRDSICFMMGLADAPGLLDLAADPKLDSGPMIVRTPIERLSVLPIGREREGGSTLFSSRDVPRVIQSLGHRYSDRLLILDAPPCLSASVPGVLAPVVGQILFVVEAERTQRDEIEASLDLIQTCPSIALVLNKQQLPARHGFGAYSSYYSS